MEKKPVSVLIALGANLACADPVSGETASPAATCEAAVAALRALPGLIVETVSPWYESEAIPPSGQPPYINGVVLGKSELGPEALLEALHGIETCFGRVRSVANAARTLDLDLIDMDGMVRTERAPLLPHPRAHERAFVLLPLRDVSAGWVHPVLRQSVETLIGALGPQDIRLLRAES
ncbi:2-amino-4-hydroxy-6-hydroxymethyldihydropteridine diphosphokinase [Acetobacter fallax]|uniref:2-amino-4-hydroxy-6-hydroxymethyldihydropteridine pyrophosphokinase n=1 Tax=Acetobacter fallax TaxID=1737473 RepID=A0ABX0K702_9PROT|nr:2-amino-4-hydroxy-6-hydroxymethyldihydropteridine diphosphokinase [Acetobacter fallax]NHO31583.1 2-amino-4-hydroxy-6-hydroxymethyldihydropteridine diphosphokinase [Acetobacter fallax]NHO35142.1 2-amino-4-hydroxy-6-hydroxymethyldihydropteridine diphosphokinase [Acetobacter fallax]